MSDPTEDLVPVPMKYGRDRERPATAPEISKMLVQLQEDFVADFYVIHTLLPNTAYVSAEIAERIKRTHAPLYKSQARQDIWVPHTPRHNHELREQKEEGGGSGGRVGVPIRGCSALSGKGNRTINKSSNAEAKRAAAYYLRKKEKRANEARQRLSDNQPGLLHPPLDETRADAQAEEGEGYGY